MDIKKTAMAATIGALLATSLTVNASSHREAPFITEVPKVDATDFYMFNSYEAGREDFVTIIANYNPLQDAYGGPNYFTMDTDALYEIHIDNNGDAVEDITFQFRFQTTNLDFQVDAGGVNVSIPLINAGQISADDQGALFRNETYSIDIIDDDRRSGSNQSITNADSGEAIFVKPVDNIGVKSIADYPSYAANHIYPVAIPGCTDGRVFVGQRQEPFAVNLGEVFDLVNTDPLGPRDGETNIIADKNVTTIALEIPKSCLVDTDSVIGGWTTASLRQARVLNPAPDFARNKKSTVEGGSWVQVSRLGNPLVNEVVIGLKDKDRFNASEPVNDAQFLTYVQNPSLPELLEILFGVTAPNEFPRTDLVAVFLTGVTGLNQPVAVVGSEMMRLNTAIEAIPAYQQNSLGVLGDDIAGYPNGRRPGDDVVDISLRAAMGVLLPGEAAPSGQLEYTDGAIIDATMFSSEFPYLNTPVAGAE